MAKISLTSARDYFEEVLKPACNRFFSEASSFQNVYAMVNSLYHFNEWIWYYEEDKLKNKYSINRKSELWHEIVENQVSDAGLVRDLNNAAKHVDLNISQGSRPSSQMQHSANTHITYSGYSDGGYGVGRYGSGKTKMMVDDCEVLLDDVAKELFAFWEKLIDEVDPKPVPVITVAKPTNPSANS